MRIVPDSMTDAWYSQTKVGAKRAVGRAIIFQQNLRRFDYDTAYVQGGDYNDDGRHRAGHFTSFIFGDSSPYRELRNIQSIEWDRSIGQDAGTMTLTMLNSEIAPIGSPKDNPTSPDEYDKPGYFTFNRGDQTVSENRWGYDTETGWNHIIMPDMVIKTYEGYGHDPTVSPPLDANLVQSGTWMIDKVTYGSDGTINIACRDLARLLLDSTVFPPAIPMSEYPLSWVKNHSEQVDGRDATGGDWKDHLSQVGTARSSNDVYVGHDELTNAPFAHYVSETGGVDGHHANHAIMKHARSNVVHKSLTSNVAHLTTDKPHGLHVGNVVIVEGVGPNFNGTHTLTAVGSSTTLAYAKTAANVTGVDSTGGTVDRADDLFWRSTGQDARNDFVWWEFDYTNGGTLPIAAIKLSMAGGPYRVYISIHNGTDWVGRHKVPYSVDTDDDAEGPGTVDIHAKIPFVKSVIADRFYHFDVTLPRVYHAKKVRLTLTRLVESSVGEHPFRGGVREMQLYTGDNLSFRKGKVEKVIGNYGDYTHIIKWVCAWAGWYWPPHSTGYDFMRIQHGMEGAEKDYITFNNNDPTLPKGRVWGDFMKTGTSGVADLTVDMFDKKPLMDIINYVRDLIGFNFFIDETGGVVWRLPNYWSLGNYLTPENVLTEDGRIIPGKRGRHGRTDEILTLDEDETLLGYTTTLDSQNIRDRIFVANAVGGIGIVIKGFNPNPVGLKRVAGWTDQHFKTKREAKVMADMISAQQEFSYRTSVATVPGYPAIQVDDQIRIFERTTNETYYHYVTGIKSSLDMTEGVWTYDLNTHWLGERPSDAWVVRVDELSNVTQQYLAAVGYSPSDSEDNDDEPHSHGVG